MTIPVNFRPRLVVLDLDGTLLRSNHTVSLETGLLLRRAESNGIHLAFATGRMHRYAKELATELGISPSYICCNGSQVVAPDGSILLEEWVPREVALSLVRWLDANKYCHYLYLPDESIFSERRCAGVEFPRTRKSVPDLATLIDSLPDKHIRKVTARCDPGNLIDLRSLIVENWGKHLTPWITSVHLIECGPPGCSKRHGLEIIARHIGVPLSSVIAFGDSENDTGVLEVAGFPVAMANAIDSIKRVAALITMSNDEDGVRLVLEEMIDRPA